MQVETLVVGPFATNCYILYGAPGGDAVIVDPGGDPQDIIAAVNELGLRVTHIFITHGHGDHIAANAHVKSVFPEARICIHPRDAHMLKDPRANMSLAFGFNLISPPADVMVEGNTEITAAGFTFAIEHVPGHSPGSICFIPRIDEHMVFAGDTLFAGSIGRTDFPGGNGGLLIAGIREKLFSLPDDTVVYPGHGIATLIRKEKESNPFTGGASLP